MFFSIINYLSVNLKCYDQVFVERKPEMITFDLSTYSKMLFDIIIYL